MLQGVMEENVAQQYPLGLRYAEEDRVYRYTRADPNRQLRAAYPVYPYLPMTETGVVALTAALGATVVRCTAVGTVVANQFANGKLVVSTGGGGGYGCQYGIRSNTGGATFDVTLRDPLVAALTVGVDTVTLYSNPYREVRCMRQEILDGVVTRYRKVSWVGVPNRFVTADYYCWAQVGGPCFVVAASDMGAADEQRMTVFSEDGSVEILSSIQDPGDQLIYLMRQMAGPLLPVTDAGNVVPSGLAYINLQLGS